MRRIRPFLILVLALCLAAGAQAQLASFKKSMLTIDTAAGPKRFIVELALSADEQAQGLMFRHSLATDNGQHLTRHTATSI